MALLSMEVLHTTHTCTLYNKQSGTIVQNFQSILNLFNLILKQRLSQACEYFIHIIALTTSISAITTLGCFKRDNNIVSGSFTKSSNLMKQVASLLPSIYQTCHVTRVNVTGYLQIRAWWLLHTLFTFIQWIADITSPDITSPCVTTYTLNGI